MIRIAVTAEAFAAIAATLPLGSDGYEREPDEKRERGRSGGVAPILILRRGRHHGRGAIQRGP
jgi:hypothetical protein